jgi:MFS family permease
MLLIIGTVSYNFTVVFPLFVEKGLHGSDEAYTFIYSSFSAGALAGALVVARRPTITVRTIAASAGAFGVTMLVLAASPDVLLACAVAAGVGGTSVAYLTATTSIAQIRTDPQMIGRVIAIQSILQGGTTPIGGPILGAISDAAGGRWPVIIGGCGAVVAAGFGTLAARRAGSRIAPEPV